MFRDAMNVHREDAFDRRSAPTEADVGRGITERAPELLAVDDVATDLERSPEQVSSRNEIAISQQITDDAAAHAFASEGEFGKHLSAETVRFTHFAQEFDISLARVTEPKISTDPDLLCLHSSDQNLLDERFGWHRSQFGVESHQVQHVHIRCADLENLAANTVKSRHRRRTREELARDRLEADRHGRDTERIGAFAHALQQRAMAAMNAIESTDTDNTASRRQTGTQAIANKTEHQASIAGGAENRGHIGLAKKAGCGKARP